MPRVKVALRVVAASADEDRTVHRADERGDLVMLADGAGGMSGGRDAANMVALCNPPSIETPADAVAELHRLDRALSEDPSCGETTAVLVVVRDGLVSGASVGDSGAWLVTTAGIQDLTSGQRHKPLLGSAKATPIGFGPTPLVGRLLIASDGLLKYASRDRIQRAALVAEISRAADELVAAARVASGTLQDDVSLVLLEAGTV